MYPLVADFFVKVYYLIMCAHATSPKKAIASAKKLTAGKVASAKVATSKSNIKLVASKAGATPRTSREKSTFVPIVAPQVVKPRHFSVDAISDAVRRAASK